MTGSMEKRDRTALPLTPVERKALEDSFKKIGSLAYEVANEHWFLEALRGRPEVVTEKEDDQ